MVVTTERSFVENAKRYLELAKKEKVVVVYDDGTEIEISKSKKL